MARALLGGDVTICSAQPSATTTIRSQNGEANKIVYCVDRSSYGLKRHVYMHNSRTVGAAPWEASGIPSGHIGTTPTDIEELVHGEVISVFNVGGQWLVAMGNIIDSSKYIGSPGTSAYATLCSCIPNSNISALGLVPTRSYAFVVQRQGIYKSWIFERDRIYCVCVWSVTDTHLKPVSRDEWNMKGCSYVRTFSTVVNSVIAEYCTRMTPSACSGLVFEVAGKFQKVVNGERRRYEELQNDTTAQLAQYIFAEHNGQIKRGDVVMKMKEAKLYLKYVDAVWVAYMVQHVWKPTRKCAPIFKNIVEALHVKYISLIGTAGARTTRKQVKNYLKSCCAVYVAKSIVTWQRQMLA